MFFRHAKEPKRRHRDSRFKQSFAFRSLCFRRCCLYAANSGTGQLAAHVFHTTQFPNAQTSPVLFPRLPLTTTHAHTVPFFRRILLRLLSLWLTAAKVIRRQGRKGCVTPPQRACRAMRRKAGDMFERSESLTAQALATNSERQATKRPKNVACDL